MSSEIKLSASVRSDAGKGASRRLRRLENTTPGIVYGGGKDAVMISLLHKDLIYETVNEAFFSSILTLDIEGTEESVILQDMQRHPAKLLIMHVDFLRVDAKTEITMTVPLHFLNEEKCEGVALEGGIISHIATEVEVRCLPGDLPEYIEVDVIELKVGDMLYLTDLNLPEGVESTVLSHGEDHNQPVVAVNAKKREEPEEDEAAESTEEAADDDKSDADED